VEQPSFDSGLPASSSPGFAEISDFLSPIVENVGATSTSGEQKRDIPEAFIIQERFPGLVVFRLAWIEANHSFIQVDLVPG
jgi:hypothetical protein